MKILLAVYPPISIGLVSFFSTFFTPLWLAIPLILLFMLMIADTRARLNEYMRLRNLIHHGKREACYRMIEAMGASWCGRVAANAACIHEKVDYNEYFYSKYKWYHIFPDGLFSLNSVLFKKNWWLATVGIKRR